MGLFGRETQADVERAQRVKRWATARSPLALFSALLGAIAVLDFFTPIGPILGVVAITLGVLGLRDLRRRPHLLGARLCGTGITLGAVGVVLGGVMWVFVYR